MEKTNVIIFFTDQQRWDSTGVHGNPLGLTPNFDYFAETGTDIHYSFTCHPVCTPARACLQTGMYGTETGVYKNDEIPLPTSLKTLAHFFREAGYYTGYIGKWHLGITSEQAVSEEMRGGYQYWLAANALELCSDSYNTIVFDEDNEEVRLPGYRVDALTDAAIRFVDKNKEIPFFLFLSLVEPHQQNSLDDFVPPNVYNGNYNGKWTPPDLQTLSGSSGQHLGKYWGMIKRIDEAFGRLLDAIKSLGLTEKTIILFTSDHGCHFKTRNEEYKRSCHESSIRVPTAFSGPGFNAGRRINELVSLIDIPPTLLDAVGIDIPAQMQGQSIFSLIKEKTESWPEEVFVQISESCVGRAIRTKRWKYGIVAPGKNGYEVKGADFYEEEFLYDLVADPYELNNLIELPAFQETKDELRQRLIQCMVRAGEDKPEIKSNTIVSNKELPLPLRWRKPL